MTFAKQYHNKKTKVMKRYYQLFFKCIIACAIPFTMACSSDDDATPEPGPDPVVPGDDIIKLSSDGEQKDIIIPSGSSWEASSSADWLQLSQMGGKGGESVKLIAACNVTQKERIGYIRFGSAPGTRAQTDSMQIAVKQPAAEGETTGVVLTSAFYKDGKVYVRIYNGRQSESSMQQLGIVQGSDFSFTDPTASYPGKEPIVYIKKGEEHEACPYVTLNAEGEAKGKFSISGEASVNTLRVKQNIVHRERGDLGNSGSATVHFTDGDIIYLGGGTVEKTSLGYEQHIKTNELRSYNTATGEEKAYADMPCEGQGFCWNGMPFIIGDNGIYYLNGGKWSLAAARSGKVFAATVKENTAYAVGSDAVCSYTLKQEGDGKVTVTDNGASQHGMTFSEDIRTTSDGTGTTWLLDDSYRTAYSINGNELAEQRCVPADTLAADFRFIGVADGCVYAISGESIGRYEAGSSYPQPLRMLGTFSWPGETECVSGVLYNFGGLVNFRGTYTASKTLGTFSPADYAPVSVSILPE